MKKWCCRICGYVHEGDKPPDHCPVCGAGPEDFKIMEDLLRPSNQTHTEQIIIIGNGASGMEAARTLREQSPTAGILVFSAEPYHFYSRIHLSTFIGDESHPPEITIYPESWYADHRIEIRLNTFIKKILPDEMRVIDDQGKSYPYSRLILACGATPGVPPIPGSQLVGVFVLRTLENALAIRQYARQCHSAVILGGGILGIEVASSLRKRGLAVSIFEMADHLMPQQLDREGGAVLKSVLNERGISCYCQSRVREFAGHNRLEKVITDTGQELAFDMAIIAVGIIPDTRVAIEAGIKVNKGVIVDEYLATSHPDIFAVGDMAEFQGHISGIWPAAVGQGRVAALNALGITHPYSGTLPLHILKVAGIEMTALGKKYIDQPGEKQIIYREEATGKYVKLIHNHETLLGAVVLGVRGIGFRLEKIIQQRKNISTLLPELKKGNWEILKSYNR